MDITNSSRCFAKQLNNTLVYRTIFGNLHLLTHSAGFGISYSNHAMHWLVSIKSSFFVSRRRFNKNDSSSYTLNSVKRCSIEKEIVLNRKFVRYPIKPTTWCSLFPPLSTRQMLSLSHDLYLNKIIWACYLFSRYPALQSLQDRPRINDILTKYAYGSNIDFKEMEVGSFDDGEDVEHNGVGLLEIHKMIANASSFFDGSASFSGVWRSPHCITMPIRIQISNLLMTFGIRLLNIVTLSRQSKPHIIQARIQFLLHNVRKTFWSRITLMQVIIGFVFKGLSRRARKIAYSYRPRYWKYNTWMLFCSSANGRVLNSWREWNILQI